MRAPPDMSNAIIVLKAGLNPIFREIYLWLGIRKITTKPQETKPICNTLDVTCSMSIQFPGGFQFQGNFLIALSFSTSSYSFCYKKKEKKGGGKNKKPRKQRKMVLFHKRKVSYNTTVYHETILCDCITVCFSMIYVFLNYSVPCCRKHNALFSDKTFY